MSSKINIITLTTEAEVFLLMLIVELMRIDLGS